jgi:hypothetical protein
MKTVESSFEVTVGRAMGEVAAGANDPRLVRTWHAAAKLLQETIERALDFTDLPAEPIVIHPIKQTRWAGKDHGVQIRVRQHDPTTRKLSLVIRPAGFDNRSVFEFFAIPVSEPVHRKLQAFLADPEAQEARQSEQASSESEDQTVTPETLKKYADSFAPATAMYDKLKKDRDAASARVKVCEEQMLQAQIELEKAQKAVEHFKREQIDPHLEEALKLQKALNDIIAQASAS